MILKIIYIYIYVYIYTHSTLITYIYIVVYTNQDNNIYVCIYIYIYIYVVNTKEVSAILSKLTRLHKSEEKTHDSLSTFLLKTGEETTPPPKHPRTSPYSSERSEFARKRKPESQIVEELLGEPNQELLSLYRSNRRSRRKTGKASYI